MTEEELRKMCLVYQQDPTDYLYAKIIKNLVELKGMSIGPKIFGVCQPTIKRWAKGASTPSSLALKRLVIDLVLKEL